MGISKNPLNYVHAYKGLPFVFSLVASQPNIFNTFIHTFRSKNINTKPWQPSCFLAAILESCHLGSIVILFFQLASDWLIHLWLILFSSWDTSLDIPYIRTTKISFLFPGRLCQHHAYYSTVKNYVSTIRRNK